jgi:hypothetical protein
MEDTMNTDDAFIDEDIDPTEWDEDAELFEAQADEFADYLAELTS